MVYSNNRRNVNVNMQQQTHDTTDKVMLDPKAIERENAMRKTLISLEEHMKTEAEEKMDSNDTMENMMPEPQIRWPMEQDFMNMDNDDNDSKTSEAEIKEKSEKSAETTVESMASQMNQPTNTSKPTGIGGVVVQVLTSKADPVSDATVIILHSSANGDEILAYSKTDENGRTRVMNLPSKEPSDIKSYETYDVTVNHNSFDRAKIKDVQVFDGMETLQEVELAPKSIDTSNQE